MSSGLECEFYGESDTAWFYVLQDYDCPVGAWDWREVATAYGPFGSYEQAQEHLRNNHANPGGHSFYRPGTFRVDDTLAKLFSEARAENERQARDDRRWGRW